MHTPMFDAILLDAAGTLIEPAEPVASTYARFAGRFGAEIAPEALLGPFREVFAAMPPMAFEIYDDDTLEALERAWWRRLVSQVIAKAEAEIADFDAFFDALYGHYARGDAWTLYPEVEEVLKRLAGRGYALAVVSNFDSRLPAILKDHGLAPLMQEIVYSTGVGAAKPDSRIFQYALGKLGANPARTLHVGDSREADYTGAENAGLKGLLLRRADASSENLPEHVIGTLDQLLTWLDARG